VRVTRVWVAGLTLFGLVGVPNHALAWGKIGHRVAAALAARRLSPAAASAVRNLLEPGESLADASLWADDHRRDVEGSAGWHFVDVAISEPRYDARYCPAKGCVVLKIVEMQNVLASAHDSVAERRQALRFLVHLVEDLHQPLHVGGRDDRGGNDLQVRFFDRGTNLHRVWDEGLIEHFSTDEDVWLGVVEKLATQEASQRWCQGTVEDYATESLKAAREAYSVPGETSFLEPGARLDRTYFERELPVVNRRLAQAGARLACLLNRLFRP
jgi:hypothetical protein